MGSPHYMSPEQMRASQDVDARTDIWALGVMLYELITGQVPFTGETLPEICIKIATEQPPPLRALRPDAPAGLEAVLPMPREGPEPPLPKRRRVRAGARAVCASALARERRAK